ncbi:MAG: UDP-2,4-diacetamido-2,4,6-trideoxy-beta-L-altropyranose hydrolase [Phenylobacterium sp.]|uniref:UDP-2,4-diacetamido-2,4, 6-trideoxy-beta-L-altropyranose hydrolase n=1 Tax=Phenylobacterium sp. TaxID=1871053 RepID=UPI00391D7B3B
MSDAPRILFVCNAGAQVGGGHVMRSLTLAEALADRGAACRFLAPPPVAAILDAFAPRMARAPAASTAPDDLIAAAAGLAADAVVFDHYGLAAPEHRRIAAGRPALAIDDLADRPLDAALVLDSGPARSARDYAGLLPPGAQVLAGPAFAPVRPAFAALRAEALARRPAPVRRVLVSLGLTDVGAVTARLVERLQPLLGAREADVVVGAAAPSLPRLRALAAADPRLRLHVDATDMARLTLDADLAVGAAGSTTWERCVLALPSLLVVLADNQRAAARAMDEAGAALMLEADAMDFDQAFAAALRRLLDDQALRARLAQRSAEVCDGLGAPRVAAALLALIAGCDTSSGQP